MIGNGGWLCLAVPAMVFLGFTFIFVVSGGSADIWVVDEQNLNNKFGFFKGCEGDLCDNISFRDETAHAIRASKAFCVLTMISNVVASLLSVLICIGVGCCPTPGLKKLGGANAVTILCAVVFNVLCLIVFEVAVYRKYFDNALLERGVSFWFFVISDLCSAISGGLLFFGLNYGRESQSLLLIQWQAFSYQSVTANVVETQSQRMASPTRSSSKNQQHQQQHRQKQQGQTRGQHPQQRQEQPRQQQQGKLELAKTDYRRKK